MSAEFVRLHARYRKLPSRVLAPRLARAELLVAKLKKANTETQKWVKSYLGSQKRLVSKLPSSLDSVKKSVVSSNQKTVSTSTKPTSLPKLVKLDNSGSIPLTDS